MKKKINQRVAYCTLFRRSHPNSRDCHRTSMSEGCTRLWPFDKWTHQCCTLVSLKSQQNKTFVYRFMQIMMVVNDGRQWRFDNYNTVIWLYYCRMIYSTMHACMCYACVWVCVCVCVLLSYFGLVGMYIL